MTVYGINHESGTLKRVMVHHPGPELELANKDPKTHNFDQPVNPQQFKEEHLKLMEELEEVGVEVLDVGTLISDDPNARNMVLQCPNLVFTRDSSSVTDAGALLFRMGLPSRRKETPVIEAVYRALGIPVAYNMKEPDTFEGGGLALLEGGTAVTGLCQRTTEGALEKLGEYLLNEKLIDLYIVLNLPPEDIHIDGDFAELPGKNAIVYRQSLDFGVTEFRTRKDRWQGSFTEWLSEEGWDLIEITGQECIDMAANFLTVAPDLVFHYTGNPRVMREVRDRRIEVVQIPGEEMRKGNGGIHCMTCPILRT